MKLSDIERKVLRILNNYSITHHKMPSFYLLRAKTGRNEEGIKKVLSGLADKEFIQWNLDEPLSKIKIIQAFEKNLPRWLEKYF